MIPGMGTVVLAATAPLLWIPFGVFIACLLLAAAGAVWFDRDDHGPDA